jgi:hypothetical protein
MPTTYRQQRRPPQVNDGDGRYYAQYAVDHCVCAYCWGPLTQIFDEDEGKWKAVCAANELHRGFHHAFYKQSEIDRHSIEVMQIKEFYRRTEFAAGFGLEPPLHGAELKARLEKYRKVLGRDDSGL